MLFTNKEFVEDTVIRLLSQGKKTPAELFQALPAAGQDVSIQALYKALRYLRKESVIVKSGKELAISQEWVASINKAFQNAFSIPVLAEGESVSYDYNTLVNLDAYWKHLIRTLQDMHGNYPTFLFSPFGIWFHVEGRQESQLGMMQEFEKAKRYGFYVVASGSPLDKSIKAKFQNDFLQIDLWSRSPFPLNDYFTVIGDYVIITRLSRALSKVIEEVYQISTDESSFENNIDKVLQVSSRAQVKIYRNAVKARKLRKKMFKNFYLPPTVKNRYQLF